MTMRLPDRWVWKKPSKAIILAIAIFFILTCTQTIRATKSQNKTLSEVSFYNFSKGFYNVVKYAENDESDFRIIHENKEPYLNITFTAPSDGYLDIYLTPLAGPFPYIELGDYWEIKSLTYSKTLEKGKSTYFLLTPPMIFSSSNFSRVVGGEITIWELYKWPDLSGLINYTFTSTDEISFDLIWYPINPRQGEQISLYTVSNVKTHKIAWTILGEETSWENTTDLLEIASLAEGDYSVSVLGYDEFNNSHQAEAKLKVNPPVVEQAYFDLSVFSFEYPEKVDLGNPITFTATIDYFLPTSTAIKLLVQDPAGLENYSEIESSLTGNGSIQLASILETRESGVMNFNLRLFYSDGGHWVESDEAIRSFSVNVIEYDESPSMPSFSLISLSVGLILVLTVNRLRLKEIN